ncbi:MAG TPA: hypothetical protein VK816_03035 [Jatrophihabitantaceae bacterium]|nr:hypothetical protein [Jatrophihabitantaceae bacterium]
MTEADDVYCATVGELFDNFRCALLAILPIADRAKINYRDEETHRDWERLAEGMFDAFIRSPIASDRAANGREFPLARYDIDVDDYLEVSWLASNADSPHSGAVIRFLSQGAPFDTAQVVDIDPVTLRSGKRRTVAVAEIKPALYRRRESGEDTVVTQIEAVE